MNFKKLGNTDIDVSTICLGTMTWGEQNSEKDAFEQMDYAFEKNVNFQKWFGKGQHCSLRIWRKYVYLM